MEGRSVHATVLRDVDGDLYLLFTVRNLEFKEFSTIAQREEVWLKGYTGNPVRLSGNAVDDFMVDHPLQAIGLAARGSGPFYTIYHGAEVRV